MGRPPAAALVLGLLNAVVSVAALAVVDALTADAGWYAYAPLQDVVVEDPRFPWHLVVVPLSLLVVNALAVPVLLRSTGRAS